MSDLLAKMIPIYGYMGSVMGAVRVFLFSV